MPKAVLTIGFFIYWPSLRLISSPNWFPQIFLEGNESRKASLKLRAGKIPNFGQNFSSEIGINACIFRFRYHVPGRLTIWRVKKSTRQSKTVSSLSVLIKFRAKKIMESHFWPVLSNSQKQLDLHFHLIFHFWVLLKSDMRTILTNLMAFFAVSPGISKWDPIWEMTSPKNGYEARHFPSLNSLLVFFGVF